MPREQRIDERSQHSLGEGDVERPARQARPVSDAAQPVVRGPQRPVTGEETGTQQHRLAQSAWTALAAKGGGAAEAGGRGTGAPIEPTGRQRADTNTAAPPRPAGGREL